MDNLVSVIVPVYNVENYVDKCILSIVSQTYPHLEILIMEGKSTDNSLEFVKKWAKGDSRIRIISRRDKGLGDARNLGAEIAKGKYIFFLDSDDWMSKDTIEKLITIAKNDDEIDFVQADVICSCSDYENRSNNDSTFLFSSFRTKSGLMYIGHNYIWGKLIKKKFYRKCKFTQLNIPCEDLVIYPALVAAASKIAYCNGARIYYRVDRPGSLSSSGKEYLFLPEIIRLAKNEMKRLNLYGAYRNVFKNTMLRHFRKIVEHGIGSDGFYNLKKINWEVYKFYKKEFEMYSSYNCWAFGGFALRWIAHRLPNDKEGLKKHFTFTSIISEMTYSTESMEISHSNKFRENAISYDYTGYALFYRSEKPELLLIDLIQECTDIALLDNGNIITLTEPLKESSFDAKHIKEIYHWNSDEFFELWKSKCATFISKIEKQFMDTKLILVENYFSNSYRVGDKLIRYELEIDVCNELLRKMYWYFKSISTRFYFVKPVGVNNFTDTVGQQYSPSPSYMNSYYYDYMARKIFEYIVV